MLVVGLVSAGMGAQEERKIPKGSLELIVVGCLKDRILTTTRTPRVVDGEDPDVAVDEFQVAGKKPVLDEVKKHDRHEVEVVGLVRKSDLREPGIQVPGGRVVISPGRGGDGYGPPMAPARRVVLLQASSVRPLGKRCDR